MSKLFEDMNSIERYNRYNQVLYNMSKKRLRDDQLIQEESKDIVSDKMDKLLRLIASNASFFDTIGSFVKRDTVNVRKFMLIDDNYYTSYLSSLSKMIFQYNSIINILEDMTSEINLLSRHDITKILIAVLAVQNADVNISNNLTERTTELLNKQNKADSFFLIIKNQQSAVGVGSGSIIPSKYL
jgi:hypothetical protein